MTVLFFGIFFMNIVLNGFPRTYSNSISLTGSATKAFILYAFLIIMFCRVELPVLWVFRNIKFFREPFLQYDNDDLRLVVLLDVGASFLALVGT